MNERFDEKFPNVLETKFTPEDTRVPPVTIFCGDEIKSFIQSEVELARKEERERIVEMVKEMTIKESPPFNINPELRKKAEIINQYLMPYVKEALLNLITKQQ